MLALIVSTYSVMPAKSAVPAVRVSVGCPSVVEFLTVTSGTVDRRRSTPTGTCGVPAPSVSASAQLPQTYLSRSSCRALPVSGPETLMPRRFSAAFVAARFFSKAFSFLSALRHRRTFTRQAMRLSSS